MFTHEKKDGGSRKQGATQFPNENWTTEKSHGDQVTWVEPWYDNLQVSLLI